MLNKPKTFTVLVHSLHCVLQTFSTQLDFPNLEGKKRYVNTTFIAFTPQKQFVEIC